jgi:hypothetical protein
MGVASGADETSPLPFAKAKAGELPPGCTEWKDKDFVHPPLKVFEPYKRIHEFPLGAWCFHGRKAKFVPYDEKYARDAKAAGFNMLIDASAMLEPCRKVGGMTVMVPAFHHPPKRLAEGIFKRYGDHPNLVGIVVDDNNPRIYPNVIANAKWLTEHWPHLIPWDSENPDPRTQSRTTMRILGTQNYAFLRGGRGAKAEAKYTTWCNYDRLWGIGKNMSVFEIYGGNVASNQIRYQLNAALAYGAQGLVSFAYTPHRDTPYFGPQWQPDSKWIPYYKKMNDFVRLVAGRHLWGCRSYGVIHSRLGGWHRGAQHPRADRLVTRTSEYVMVGMLDPEKKFFAELKKPAEKRAVPEYFMVLDKRTTGHGNGSPMDLFVSLATSVPVVELLDATAVKGATIRKLVPGCRIRARTLHGEGFLLRVAPDIEKLLGGKGGLKIYQGINGTLAGLLSEYDPPYKAGDGPKKPDVKPKARPSADVAGTIAGTRKAAAVLAGHLARRVAAGDIPKAQADDTIRRLHAAIDATAADCARLSAKE